MILVVPHHGGRSGNVKLIENWHINEGIISVGDNPWGHPYKEILGEFGSKPLSRTDNPNFPFEWTL